MKNFAQVLRQCKHFLLLQSPTNELNAHMRAVVNIRVICESRLADLQRHD